MAGVIFLQSSFPAPDLLPPFPFADKLIHAGVYGVLAALCYRALRRASPISGFRNSWLIVVAILMASLYGARDEWHQSFIAARQADRFDVLADMVGSSMGVLGYAYLLRYLKPSANPHSLIDKIFNTL